MSEKFVLIDGHSILNRAFYGMPDLTNAAGVHTGAVYGFLNIMFKILDEEKPDYLTVAFDVHAPTFRHQVYTEYKGTRHPMPEELRSQVPLIKKVLKSMGIRIAQQAGLEADDILGTLAKKAQELGMEVSLISGDRDLLQIADEHIQIRIPKTKKGQTTIENYYAGDVLETLHVTPAEFIEVKALQGDTADNIPGVPKVGPKTAVDLITKYHSVAGVYEHLDEIPRTALRETLRANRDKAELSLFLARIKTDCDLDLAPADSRIGNFYTKEAYALYTELGFKNFLGRFDAAAVSAAAGAAEAGFSFDIIEDPAEAGIVFRKAENADGICLFPVYDEPKLPEDPVLLGAAVAFGQETHYLTGSTAEVMKDGFRTLRIAAGGGGLTVYVYHIKELFPFFEIGDEEFHDGVRLSGMFDTLIGSYLVNPLKSDYEPQDIASEYLQETIAAKEQFLGKRTFQERLSDGPQAVKETAEYACRTAWSLLRAGGKIREKLKDTGMWKLYTDMELPLSYILYDMQKAGIRVLPDKLREYGQQLEGRIAELEKQIQEEAGCEFNIASPRQLGEILFEKMFLPGAKKTKTGYSTSADILEKLAPDYPIVAHVLEYRALTKLKSTYADGLAAYIAPDSRIHTTFHQTITATGRISSTDPNLQNIPMRTEQGRAIRKVFVPKDGYVFTDSDYSQIELRILASMAGDEGMIEAFKDNKDIHRQTAAKVFHVPFDEVTPLQRRNAKAVNFGIVYGISSFGLSQDLSISRAEAKKYIDDYYEMFPGIRVFLEKQVRDAKEYGYSVTMFGRRRPIPELSSSNFMQRQFGERVAMNAPIQGTGADIMKLAMIRVYEALRRNDLKSRLILQIHDELLIETAPDEKEAVRKILEDGMKGAADLAVELEVDCHEGSDWYEAK